MDSRPAQESGRLRDLPVPELLWRLHRGGRSGCLRLHKGALEKCMWFVEGRPVFARSNEAGDRLTERLLARGLLSRAQYDQAQELIGHTTGKRIGELLLEAGLIRQPELQEALTEQILRMVDSMFSWTEGTWTFEADATSPDPVTIECSTAALIMGAARHRIPTRRLSDALGDRERCPLLDDDDLHAAGRAALAELLRLEPSEVALLSRLDGERSLAGLVDSFDVDEHELLALLYTLKLVGRLTMIAPASQSLGFR